MRAGTADAAVEVRPSVALGTKIGISQGGNIMGFGAAHRVEGVDGPSLAEVNFFAD